MISFVPRTVRPNYGDSDFWTGSDWTMSYTTCMPDCTVYVYGRCSEAGISCPDRIGADHDFTVNGWTRISSISNVEPGDVIEYNDYSICFVESGKGSNAVCSHSWFTTASGRAHNTNGEMKRYATDATGTTASSVWNYCLSKWPGRCWFTHTAGGYTSGTFRVAYRPPGGGGGGNPDEPPVDPPTPGQTGHYEWVSETVEVYEPGSADYTSAWGGGWSINGAGQASYYKGNDGTQDLPMAPSPSLSPNRFDQYWSPINCRTEERSLSYSSTGAPVWSSWVVVDSSSNAEIPVGTYAPLPGWKMEWEDGG